MTSLIRVLEDLETIIIIIMKRREQLKCQMRKKFKAMDDDSQASATSHEVSIILWGMTKLKLLMYYLFGSSNF